MRVPEHRLHSLYIWDTARELYMGDSCQRSVFFAGWGCPSRKRELNRSWGRDSFSPKYRHQSRNGVGSPRTNDENSRDLVNRELSPQEVGAVLLVAPFKQRPDVGLLNLCHVPPYRQAALTELFEMAIFGSEASAASKSPAGAAAGRPDPHKPCNGMCTGRSDTPECTLLCLEAWQNKCVWPRLSQRPLHSVDLR